MDLILIGLLGLYLSFSFWNFWMPEKLIAFTLSLDIDFERRSGEITLFLLNALIVVFIANYNYEQFFEVVKKSKLSAETHECVNAVIFSIVMAVGVILFYFKGGFNFDEKGKNLKRLSKTWLVLNGILILSTFVKNTEYVSFYGLTYKRLGVYAFLTLAIVGLVFTFLKITIQKTNAYLFNQMVWYCYGTILLCSFVNWGNIITSYNISVNKDIELYFLSSLQYNDEAWRDYFKLKNFKGGYSKYEYPAYSREAEISRYQKKSFLSKVLYYECISDEK